MALYLETNALSALSTERIKQIKKNSFTSYLSLLELISGINQENYLKRSAILRKVFINNIKVDWCLPQQIIAQSYKINYSRDIRQKPFANTIKLVCECDDYETAKSISVKNRRYWSIRSLQMADEQVAVPHVEEIKKLVKIIRIKLSKDQIHYLKVLFCKNKKDYTREDSNEMWGLLLSLKNDFVSKYAMHITKALSNQKGEVFHLESVVNNYDKTIDIHHYFNAYRYIRDSVMGNVASCNDFYDVGHLMYIRKDDKIVTLDKKIIKDMDYLYPNNYIEASIL